MILTFITLSLLSELGKIDRVFTGFGHLNTKDKEEITRQNASETYVERWGEVEEWSGER